MPTCKQVSSIVKAALVPATYMVLVSGLAACTPTVSTTRTHPVVGQWHFDKEATLAENARLYDVSPESITMEIEYDDMSFDFRPDGLIYAIFKGDRERIGTWKAVGDGKIDVKAKSRFKPIRHAVLEDGRLYIYIAFHTDAVSMKSIVVLQPERSNEIKSFKPQHPETDGMFDPRVDCELPEHVRPGYCDKGLR